MRSRIVAAVALAGLTLPIHADDEQPAPAKSVNDLMISIIAPATDTIWGIDDPRTAAEWQVFIEAANRVVEAGNRIKSGGAGPNDAAWARDAEWQALADRMVRAGVDARTAAEQQDVEAMWTAGEVLYPPCEECHLKFHPGVKGYR